MRHLSWLGGLLAACLLVVCSAGVAQAEEPARAPSCPSLEGCYDYDGMLDFYNDVLTLVDDFSEASYAGMPRPTFWYVYTWQTKATACRGPATGSAFAYCPADETVYVGQDQLWEFYQDSGDGAAAFAVAHEWGHHVQHEAGVDRYVVDQASAIQFENQADCIGGAFLGFLRDREVLEPDDYADVNLILPEIASAEDDVSRDHGTVEERDAAVQYGLDHGLAACSKYFPDAQLVT
jgi:predicted metalloprotease